MLACPASRGVLFDQPQVVEFGDIDDTPGLENRVETVAGSFFDAVPPGGDAYVMKVILHDWDDDKAIEILRSCSRAMSPTATLVVIERVIGPPNQIPEGEFSDLNMLVSHGALQRSARNLTTCLRRVAPVGPSHPDPISIKRDRRTGQNFLDQVLETD